MDSADSYVDLFSCWKQLRFFDPTARELHRKILVWEKFWIWPFGLVDSGFHVISENRFPWLFQSTYKHMKFWEYFSWSFLAVTSANWLPNASWKNFRLIKNAKQFSIKNLLLCGVHFLHDHTSHFFCWSRNHKNSIRNEFPKKNIQKCAFGLVYNLVWQQHQKNFRSGFRNILWIFFRETSLNF